MNKKDAYENKLVFEIFLVSISTYMYDFEKSP